MLVRGVSEAQKRHTCASVCIQADELYGALMWRPAVLAVLHMLAFWTVPESVAVSSKIDLNTHTQETCCQCKTHFHHGHLL